MGHFFFVVIKFISYGNNLSQTYDYRVFLCNIINFIQYFRKRWLATILYAIKSSFQRMHGIILYCNLSFSQSWLEGGREHNHPPFRRSVIKIKREGSVTTKGVGNSWLNSQPPPDEKQQHKLFTSKGYGHDTSHWNQFSIDIPAQEHRRHSTLRSSESVNLD